MAHVKNMNLRMGKEEHGRLFADVAFDVDFSAREVADRLNFGVFVRLIEVDAGRDIYVWTPNGHIDIDLQMHNPQQGQFVDPDNLDDDYGWMARQVPLTPNGQATRHLTYHYVFPVGSQEDGSLEFEATALVIPEISQGYLRSNRVNINPH